MTTIDPTDSTRSKTALVLYPASQSYVVETLRTAFSQQPEPWNFYTDRNDLKPDEKPDVQWSDYDELDWDWAMDDARLLNSFAIRKALIRKSNLSHTIALYLSKHPASPLRRAAPKTVHFNCSFADELDELLMDDLYEVEQSFRDSEEGRVDAPTWWILKAALADKGNGIRLFSTRQALEDIFQEFEPESDEDEDEDEDERDSDVNAPEGRAALFGVDTRVDSTQMREWVIQEYIADPLLLDPGPGSNEHGTKFHLRVYVVAVGGLRVYVHHPYLALFAPVPYVRPGSDATGAPAEFDLSSHLTNTCLQTSVLGDEAPQVSVACLQQLADKTILSRGAHEGERLGEERIREIERGVQETVAELFRAAIGAGSSFQCLPNAFEIFGVDFLVSSDFQVSLLEVNACPDFAQTGPALQSIISNLFASTIEVAVSPFFASASDDKAAQIQHGEGREGGRLDDDGGQLEAAFEQMGLVDAKRGGLKKVLDVQVSKAW
ncbi:hypothetical protein JCM3766R1_005718 [Sporobolomyces carnicolor]